MFRIRITDYTLTRGDPQSMAKNQVEADGSEDTSDSWNEAPRRKANRRRRKNSSDSAWDENSDDNKLEPVPTTIVEGESKKEHNVVDRIENADSEVGSSGSASDWVGSGDEKRRRRRPIRRKKAVQDESDGWSEDDAPHHASSSKIHRGRKHDSNDLAGSVFEQQVLLSRNSRSTQTTGILELASILEKTGVDGPEHYHRADMMTRKKLAGGAQFDVYIDLARDDRRARIYKVVKVAANTKSFSIVRKETTWPGSSLMLSNSKFLPSLTPQSVIAAISFNSLAGVSTIPTPIPRFVSPCWFWKEQRTP